MAGHGKGISAKAFGLRPQGVGFADAAAVEDDLDVRSGLVEVVRDVAGVIGDARGVRDRPGDVTGQCGNCQRQYQTANGWSNGEAAYFCHRRFIAVTIPKERIIANRIH